MFSEKSGGRELVLFSLAQLLPAGLLSCHIKHPDGHNLPVFCHRKEMQGHEQASCSSEVAPKYSIFKVLLVRVPTFTVSRLLFAG
uniref:Putative secreted protein n=1 Tax=Rhipicephalus microplus TaxID=6941 RepID=A0A6M2DBR5_RHIMP